MLLPPMATSFSGQWVLEATDSLLQQYGDVVPDVDMTFLELIFKLINHLFQIFTT